jgi:hypothetical protein
MLFCAIRIASSFPVGFPQRPRASFGRRLPGPLVAGAKPNLDGLLPFAKFVLAHLTDWFSRRRRHFCDSPVLGVTRTLDCYLWSLKIESKAIPAVALRSPPNRTGTTPPIPPRGIGKHLEPALRYWFLLLVFAEATVALEHPDSVNAKPRLRERGLQIYRSRKGDQLWSF